MDTFIVGSGLFLFLLFLAFQAVIARFTDPEAVITWLIRIFLSITGLLGIGFIVRIGSVEWFIGSFIIYTLLTTLYVFGIFSIVEASITLFLLREIDRDASRPPSVDTIIRRRLERLVQSGELAKRGESYVLTKRVSYFVLRERGLQMLRWVFGTMGA